MRIYIYSFTIFVKMRLFYLPIIEINFFHFVPLLKCSPELMSRY